MELKNYLYFLTQFNEKYKSQQNYFDPRILHMNAMDNHLRIKEILQICSSQNQFTDVTFLTNDESESKMVQLNANLLFLPALREKFICNNDNLALILPDINTNSIQAALDVVHRGEVLIHSLAKYEEVYEILKLFGIKSEELYLSQLKTDYDSEQDPISIEPINEDRKVDDKSKLIDGRYDWNDHNFLDNMFGLENTIHDSSQNSQSELSFNFTTDLHPTMNKENASNPTSTKSHKKLYKYEKKRDKLITDPITNFDGYKFSACHNGKDVKCLFRGCKKSFTSLQTLKEHMPCHFLPLIKRIDPSGYTKQICSFCEDLTTFASRNSYSRHVVFKHTNFFKL